MDMNEKVPIRSLPSSDIKMHSSKNSFNVESPRNSTGPMKVKVLAGQRWWKGGSFRLKELPRWKWVAYLRNAISTLGTGMKENSG